MFGFILPFWADGVREAIKMVELKGTDRYPRRRGNGFLSYVHADDDMVDGRITRLGDRLEKAIQQFNSIAARNFEYFGRWRIATGAIVGTR
jgi:hypothetical protein